MVERDWKNSFLIMKACSALSVYFTTRTDEGHAEETPPFFSHGNARRKKLSLMYCAIIQILRSITNAGYARFERMKWKMMYWTAPQLFYLTVAVYFKGMACRLCSMVLQWRDRCEMSGNYERHWWPVRDAGQVSRPSCQERNTINWCGHLEDWI